MLQEANIIKNFGILWDVNWVLNAAAATMTTKIF